MSLFAWRTFYTFHGWKRLIIGSIFEKTIKNQYDNYTYATVEFVGAAIGVPLFGDPFVVGPAGNVLFVALVSSAVGTAPFIFTSNCEGCCGPGCAAWALPDVSSFNLAADDVVITIYRIIPPISNIRTTKATIMQMIFFCKSQTQQYLLYIYWGDPKMKLLRE